MMTRYTGPTEVVLQTVGLTKQYNTRLAIQDLNLIVYRGNIFGLLGPNGSGKTTTLRLILGLIRPNRGRVFLFGRDIADNPQHRADLRQVGALIEQPTFYPFLSGRENLLGAATFTGLLDTTVTRVQVERALTQVNLVKKAGNLYKTYTSGERQRLGIAAAFLTNPALVILDEPTNGLDPAEVRRLLYQLAQSGSTIILSSHQLEQVQQICTDVAILRDGILLIQGQVDELLKARSGIQLGFYRSEGLMQASKVLQQAAKTTMPWLRGAQQIPSAPSTRIPLGNWRLLVNAPAEQMMTVNALLAAQGIYAAEVCWHEASLEDYFLTLTTSQPVSPNLYAMKQQQYAKETRYDIKQYIQSSYGTGASTSRESLVV